ncbi:MAG TPA: LytTR family DNA-binding domain-containing protein, partial [Cyclobacteriaceae bacterium]|nr:LytTR family DNA-binding domain-containing protein [Cyclobacteriaceae bacterium]
LEIVGMAHDIETAVPLIQQSNPDLLFLDVELQTGTGFELLDKIGEIKFGIVFTTAFEQYAVKAIKLSSIDYLLKPIDIEELQQAVEKAKAKRDHELQTRKLEALMSNLGATNKKKICLSTSEGMEFINVLDIVYCEANGAYTKFTLTNGTNILVSKNLKEYEIILSDQNFMRVHNSYLINLAEVKKFVKSEGGYILMKNNSQISISPKKRDEFLERMT